MYNHWTQQFTISLRRPLIVFSSPASFSLYSSPSFSLSSSLSFSLLLPLLLPLLCCLLKMVFPKIIRAVYTLYLCTFFTHTKQLPSPRHSVHYNFTAFHHHVLCGLHSRYAYRPSLSLLVHVILEEHQVLRQTSAATH